MISFGSVTHRNLKGDLRNVANVAQSSQNQNVRVQVLRNGKVGKCIQECMLIIYQIDTIEEATNNKMGGEEDLVSSSESDNEDQEQDLGPTLSNEL